MARTTSEERAETRRQTEKRRQSGKDRTAHENARGERMAISLDDLANELPSDGDLVSYIDYLIGENDRGAAVMATALVERALEDAIRAHLVDPGDGTPNTWFKGPNAPFQTFSAKIALGRALGIYGPETEGKLTGIRKIRNVFAHRMVPIQFSHPVIQNACLKLSSSRKPDGSDAKIMFGALCLALAKSLGGHATAFSGQSKHVWMS